MTLISSARRVVWMKSWEDDLASKSRLFKLPFDEVHFSPFWAEVRGGPGAVL